MPSVSKQSQEFFVYQTFQYKEKPLRATLVSDRVWFNCEDMRALLELDFEQFYMFRENDSEGYLVLRNGDSVLNSDEIQYIAIEHGQDNLAKTFTYFLGDIVYPAFGLEQYHLDEIQSYIEEKGGYISPEANREQLLFLQSQIQTRLEYLNQLAE